MKRIIDLFVRKHMFGNGFIVKFENCNYVVTEILFASKVLGWMREQHTEPSDPNESFLGTGVAELSIAPAPTIDEAAQGLRNLLWCFQRNGYMSKFSVSQGDDDNTQKIFVD